MKKNNYLSLLLLMLFMLFAASCVKGPAGAQGPAGPAGPQGPPGVNGATIYSGTAVPDASIGNAGDFYIDLSTGEFYGPKTSTGWAREFHSSVLQVQPVQLALQGRPVLTERLFIAEQRYLRHQPAI